MISDTDNSDPERVGLIDRIEDVDLPKDLPELAIKKKTSRNLPGQHGLYNKILKVLKFLQRDDSTFILIILQARIVLTSE